MGEDHISFYLQVHTKSVLVFQSYHDDMSQYGNMSVLQSSEIGAVILIK